MTPALSLYSRSIDADVVGFCSKSERFCLNGSPGTDCNQQVWKCVQKQISLICRIQIIAEGHMMHRMKKQEQNLTRYKQIRWTCNGLANLFLDPASADLWMMLLTVELQRLVFNLLTKGRHQ